MPTQGSTDDGFVAVATDATWAAFRANTGGKSSGYSNQTDTIIAKYLGTNTYQYHQVWMQFDVSGHTQLPTSATLNFTVESINDSPTLTLLKGTWAGSGHSHGANILNACNFSTPYATTNLSMAVQSYSIALNSDALADIRDDNQLNIMFVEHHMMSDSTPPTSGEDFQIEIAMTDNSNSSKRPNLVVVDPASTHIISLSSGLIQVKSGKVVF